jgi:hypothetical protein
VPQIKSAQHRTLAPEIARAAELLPDVTRYARLDADRTAEPRTYLTAPVEGGSEGTCWAGNAAWHVDRDTGARTALRAFDTGAIAAMVSDDDRPTTPRVGAERDGGLTTVATSSKTRL